MFSYSDSEAIMERKREGDRKGNRYRERAGGERKSKRWSDGDNRSKEQEMQGRKSCKWG